MNRKRAVCGDFPRTGAPRARGDAVRLRRHAGPGLELSGRASLLRKGNSRTESQCQNDGNETAENLDAAFIHGSITFPTVRRLYHCAVLASSSVHRTVNLASFAMKTILFA